MTPPTPPPVPARLEPQRRPGHSGLSVLTYLWALLPLLTFGLATPITIGLAAARLRSKPAMISAALYLGGWAVVFQGAYTYAAKPPPVIDAIMTVSWLMTWFGGTTHAFILRRRLFAPRLGEAANRAAEQAALARRSLRAQARDLAQRDPALARELNIGRPDLPRAYDDGGLVDINHAPVASIQHATGLTASQAMEVTKLRGSHGPFVSAEDLSMLLELDPEVLPHLIEYTVYLR